MLYLLAVLAVIFAVGTALGLSQHEVPRLLYLRSAALGFSSLGLLTVFVTTLHQHFLAEARSCLVWPQYGASWTRLRFDGTSWDAGGSMKSTGSSSGK